ncbi:MAG: YlmC/YmxH family sporulation protein [Ruminococcaceae bacterium]|nr:YlmC/YmxH family sporulation protein [Oscillospiraceae bacterium]
MISLSMLSQKDVISVVTGQNIGRVDDIEFCRDDARVQHLIIFGRPKFFGLLGREEDVRIPWDGVVTIGKDAVLVNSCEVKESRKKQKFSINFE